MENKDLSKDGIQDKEPEHDLQRAVAKCPANALVIFYISPFEQ